MFGAYTPLAATRLDAPLFIPIQRLAKEGKNEGDL